jgi:GT2 family glycosyltransferase
MLSEVIVLDDASDPPSEPGIRARFCGSLPLNVIRQETNLGYIVGRNQIMARAQTEYVLLLDDDAKVFDPDAVSAAVRALASDPSLGAKAFAQAEPDGSPWPLHYQPAPVDYRCFVPAFIGFAHLLRRSLFAKLGGYREVFYYYGEEKEYSLRVLNAGYRIAYFPDCRIGHLIDSSGRDALKCFHYRTRNDCLSVLFNLPWYLAATLVLQRVLFYRKNAFSNVNVDDAEGRRWLIGELWRSLPIVRRDRAPVRWSTIREWQRLKRSRPRYLVKEIVPTPTACESS